MKTNIDLIIKTKKNLMKEFSTKFFALLAL